MIRVSHIQIKGRMLLKMSLEYSSCLFNPTSEENMPEDVELCLRHAQEQVRLFIVDAAHSGMTFDL
jgi:hypothetical protein